MTRELKLVKTALEDDTLFVTLSNPRRKNAIGPAMIDELIFTLDGAREDAAVRTVVLTGEGDAFCAGGDFSQMTSASSDQPPLGDYADLLLRMTNSPKPIVARVNGTAMGGGLGLVAASHFAVAKKGAMFGTPEIDVGLFPMMIMAVLQRIVPKRRLLEMSLFGERFDADEAHRLGLVNKVVEPDALDGAVQSITSKLHAKSRMTIKLGLEAYAAQDDMDLESALPLLRERLGLCFSTDDAREGLTAFLEKRAPKWSGK